MSDNTNQQKRIQLIVSQDNFDFLQGLAKSKGIHLTDLVREAIQNHVRALGYDIELQSGNWGGRRKGSGRKSKDTS